MGWTGFSWTSWRGCPLQSSISCYVRGRRLNRHQQLTALFKAHSPHSALRAGRFEGLLQFQRSAHQWRGDAPVLLLESRYEQMVGDFAGWLRQLLAALPFPPAARRELHASLLADFRDEFTAPDGGHKHALFAGARLRGTPPPHPPPGHIRPPGPDRCTRGRRRQSGQAQAGHGGDAARHAPDRARGVRAGLWLVRRRATGGFARERPRRLLPRGGRASADAREAMQAVVNQRFDISCTNCRFWRMWVIT